MSVAASAQAPSAANGTKARPLSPRAELVFTVGLYLAMATFAVAVCGLMIVAGASTREGRDGRGERRGKRERERERERKRLKVSAFPGFQLLVVLFSCVTTREKNPTNTPTHPHTHTDVENTSWLSHTTLGAKVRPLLTRKPFLVGGFFNTGAFGAVMAYARLHEHQRYLEDEREKEAAAATRAVRQARATPCQGGRPAGVRAAARANTAVATAPGSRVSRPHHRHISSGSRRRWVSGTSKR